MSTEHVYRVIVTREDGAWLADVPEVEGAHTYARTLPALDRAVREVVVMAADRPDEDMPALQLTYDYRTGDPDIDATAAEVRTLREQADQLTATATARTSAAATLLVDRGFSVRCTRLAGPGPPTPMAWPSSGCGCPGWRRSRWRRRSWMTSAERSRALRMNQLPVDVIGLVP